MKYYIDGKVDQKPFDKFDVPHVALPYDDSVIHNVVSRTDPELLIPYMYGGSQGYIRGFYVSKVTFVPTMYLDGIILVFNYGSSTLTGNFSVIIEELNSSTSSGNYLFDNETNVIFCKTYGSKDIMNVPADGDGVKRMYIYEDLYPIRLSGRVKFNLRNFSGSAVGLKVLLRGTS